MLLLSIAAFFYCTTQDVSLFYYEYICKLHVLKTRYIANQMKRTESIINYFIKLMFKQTSTYPAHFYGNTFWCDIQ